jgi:hypothetical protein
MPSKGDTMTDRELKNRNRVWMASLLAALTACGLPRAARATTFAVLPERALQAAVQGARTRRGGADHRVATFDPASSTCSSDYFGPFPVGATWTYGQTGSAIDGSTFTATEQVTVTGSSNGFTTEETRITITTLPADGSSMTDSSRIVTTLTASGAETEVDDYALNSPGDQDGTLLSKGLFSPPLGGVPSSLVQGHVDMYSSEVTETDYAPDSPPQTSVAPVSNTITVLGYEDITVPAGSFDNALKLSIQPDGLPVTEFVWLAPGVGEVAASGEDSAGSSQSVLTSYVVCAPPVTPIATPSVTPTPTTVICAGDCSGTHSVAVNDIIVLVNIALGSADASACPNGIPSGDSVDIALIIQAVNNALNDCPMANPTPTATPGEVTPIPTPKPTSTPGGGEECLRVSGGNSSVEVVNSSNSWIDVYLGSAVGFGGDQAPGECFLYGIQLDDGEALDTQVQISQCTPAGDGSCGDPPNDFGPTEYVPIDLQPGQTVTISVGSNFFN